MTRNFIHLLCYVLSLYAEANTDYTQYNSTTDTFSFVEDYADKMISIDSSADITNPTKVYIKEGVTVKHSDTGSVFKIKGGYVLFYGGGAIYKNSE